MADIIFANGIIYKQPRAGAPDFVKGALSFKVEEAIAFLKENEENGWCNVNLLVSKAGKPYAALDTWKPNSSYNSTAKNVNNNYVKSNKYNGNEDDIPFWGEKNDYWR